VSNESLQEVNEMRPLTIWLFTGGLLAVLLGSALAGAIKPLSVVAGVGEEFSLDIVVENVEELYAWQIVLEYDPEVLKIVRVEQGEFLKPKEKVIFLSPQTWEGRVLVGASLFGRNVQGVSGSGVLARITFLAENEGTSGLNFVDTLLLTNRGESISHISHQAVGGSFQTPDVSSSVPTPQVEQAESEATEEQASETKPAVQGTNSVALLIEVVGKEDVQMDQHDQQAQPAPTQEAQSTQETQTTENTQTTRGQTTQPGQEEEITGVPVIYLTLSAGG
jgi:hypothetical protein